MKPHDHSVQKSKSTYTNCWMQCLIYYLSLLLVIAIRPSIQNEFFILLRICLGIYAISAETSKMCWQLQTMDDHRSTLSLALFDANNYFLRTL